jgi:hypothetical protein
MVPYARTWTDSGPGNQVRVPVSLGNTPVLVGIGTATYRYEYLPPSKLNTGTLERRVQLRGILVL